MVRRIFVQKREGFNVEAKEILNDLRENLKLNNLKDLKILNRYDVENISEDVFEKAKNTIFSEPPVDICYEEEYKGNLGDIIFGVEFLPGQFDQRANSLSECLQIVTGGEKLLAKSAKIYVLVRRFKQRGSREN